MYVSATSTIRDTKKQANKREREERRAKRPFNSHLTLFSKQPAKTKDADGRDWRNKIGKGGKKEELSSKKETKDKERDREKSVYG